MEIGVILWLIAKIILIAGIVIFSAILSFLGIPVAIIYLIIATIHYWQYGSVVFSGTQLLVLTLLTVLAVFLDNLVLFLGLKKTDASRKGYIGSIIGSVAGLFTVNLVTLLLFTAIGAVLGELIHGKSTTSSVKSGVATALSVLFGTLVRAILTLTIAVFVLKKLLL